jgi:hypothetical protein
LAGGLIQDYEESDDDYREGDEGQSQGLGRFDFYGI